MQTPFQLADTGSGWHLYFVQLDSVASNKTRKPIFEEIGAANIGEDIQDVVYILRTVLLDGMKTDE